MKMQINKDDMIEKKSWDEFRSTGLLLIINQLLHCFGWCIVVEVDKDGKVVNCYPARTKFRGFNHDDAGREYEKVSKYLAENAVEMHKEVMEDSEDDNSDLPTFDHDEPKQ